MKAFLIALLIVIAYYTIKLSRADVEDWIRCEIWWDWKDWICYVTDCINKRVWE